MTYNFMNKYQDSNFLGVEPLEFEEESQSTDYMSSQEASPSPLTNRYRVRLSKPPMPKRRKLNTNSIILQSSTTSDTEEPVVTNEMNALSSSKSVPDTITNHSIYRFDSNSDASISSHSNSDRFIPSRFEFGTNCRDSFNMTDKLYNSPLSLVRNKNKNKNKKSKSVDCNDESRLNTPNEYKSDSSYSTQKYDECLQNVLLTKQSLFTHIVPNNDEIANNCNTNHNLMNEYHHHLEECQHFNSESNTNNKTPNCICKYVVNERLNYNDSPRKVFKFNSSNDKKDNDDINISCLPNAVNKILQNNKNGVNNNNLTSINNTSNVSIPSEPIKTIDLSTKHKYKQLLNDYYYHLMDFKRNQNFGCIAIKDSLHLIRGHFGNLDYAEENKYISSLNKRARISRKEYHFCSIKLSPNNNSTNPHILCLGDNFGRLLFYDYIRASYISTIYKSNECRISVIDWKNHYNSNNGIIAVGSLDKYIRIYDDRFCQQIYKLKYHRGEVCGLRWNEYNEHLLLSGGNQNIVCCWDIRKNGNPLFVGKHKAAIRALTWYPDCDNMFISGGGSNDQCIKIWNLNYKKERLSLYTGSQVCNLECLQYNKQNYLVSSHGFSSNSVIIWNMNHRINSQKNQNNILLTRIKQLSGHKCRVLYLCKYSDCNIVSASAGPDQTIKYWKIFPNQLETPFMHHMQNIIR